MLNDWSVHFAERAVLRQLFTCPWMITFAASESDQAPVVQKVDNAIHRIPQLVSLTPIRWIVIHPGDSAFQLLNNWGQLDKQPRSQGSLLPALRSEKYDTFASCGGMHVLAAHTATSCTTSWACIIFRLYCNFDYQFHASSKSLKTQSWSA